MSDQITVDIEVLQNFRATLDIRLVQLQQAKGMLDWLGHHGNTPEFGQFPEAQAAVAWHTRLHAEHSDKVERLRLAIVAAQDATDKIISGYTGTDQNNAAKLNSIAELLTPITASLVQTAALAVEDAVTDMLGEF